jgi:hypothetical protein
MTDHSRPALRSHPWFDAPPPGARGETVVAALVKTGIGFAVGAIFYAIGAHTLAVIVWVIAGVIGVISVASQRGRSGIGRFFATLGRLLGTGLGVVLLVPVFLIGFTASRMVSLLSRRDPLRLRDADRHTFWLECDRDERKLRHIRSMFTTEVPEPGGRRLLPLAAGVILLMIASEVLLRLMGFGDPVLYRPDAIVGYYPAPNQDVQRSGGRVIVNRFGMRAPDFTETKPPGVLRILMLGDSTLWGGSYVDQEELYARRLEQALNDLTGGRRVEILNMGVNGWGPGNKRGYVEKFGTFGADIAVVCMPYGDVYRGFGGLESKPYLPEHSPPRLAMQEVMYHLIWRLQASMIGAPNPEQQEVHAQRGIASYVELSRELREAGCEVMFAVLPSRTAGLGGGVPQDEQQRIAELRMALEPEGVAVDYPGPVFAAAKDQALVYHDESHLHRRGHELYAAYLAAQIESQSSRFSQWAAATEHPARAVGGGS